MNIFGLLIKAGLRTDGTHIKVSRGNLTALLGDITASVGKIGGLQSSHYYIADVAAADTVSIVNAANLTNTARVLAAQPDVPRNLVCTIVDTTPSITGGTITIVGKDACGNAVTEVLTAGAGAQTITGNVAFSVITSITLSGFTVLGGSGDETFAVGVGTKLGIPSNGILSAVFKAAAAGANEAVGTVNTTYKTIIPTSAPNGTTDYDFWYQHYLKAV